MHMLRYKSHAYDVLLIMSSIAMTRTVIMIIPVLRILCHHVCVPLLN